MVQSDGETRLIYASGQCEIDVARRELRILNAVVPVGGRAFEIIEVLVQSAGELVTKDELTDRVWPGAAVLDNTLQVHVAAVRKALGPYRDLLKTESGRGYRLLGDWAVRQRGTTTSASRLRGIEADDQRPLNNFPAPVSRLFGRSVAVAHLEDLISAYRAVTLTGTGGIGKTSLALTVARRIVEGFADGGCQVELASLSDPGLVPSALANALGLRLSGGELSVETVARAVREKHLLLVLDNCEHVIGAVATLVETILGLCARVTILATSREFLGVQGEYVFRVPPLEVPAHGLTDPDDVMGHSAVEMFIARTKQMDSGFAPAPDELPTITTICRHLDGIPLAIEFAAARTSVLGMRAIADGLADRFSLLTSGRRTALPRHRTLRATLDWSYNLLTEAECDLLRRLAIFAGPFSLDAARTVAAEGTTGAQIAEGIAGLVGKSLIFRTGDAATATFRLLETIRAYGMGRLVESGALDEVARRHAAYCLTALASVDDTVLSQPREAYLSTFRRLADEIHVGLDWAFSNAGDATVGLALTAGALPLWFELFQMSVARGRVEQSLRHVEAGSEMEMRLRIALGHVLWHHGAWNEIEPAFARALEIADRIGVTSMRTRALWGVWAARRGRGEYLAALDVARRFADAAVSANDPGATHMGDRILGLTHHLLGQQVLARTIVERALRQPHLLDPTSGIGFQVETPAAMGGLLARILWLSGFPDQAKLAANAAVVAAQNGGHSFSVCYAVSFAGLPVALWIGDMGEARRQFDLFVASAGGMQRMELRVRSFARILKLHAGDERAALISSFIQSHADPAHIPPFADLDADADIRVPMPGAEPLDGRWNTPEVLRVDAELLLWHDRPGAVASAEAKLLQAQVIARKQSALSWELRVATSLARLWRRHGRAAEARDLLIATFERFTEGFGTTDLLRARALIAELVRFRPRG